MMNLIAKDQLTTTKDWLPISLRLQIPGNDHCLTHLLGVKSGHIKRFLAYNFL